MRESVEGGARAVVLREKDLPFDERASLARKLLDILRPAGATMIVASDMILAQSLQVQWVHLAGRDRKPSHATMKVGCSCHSEDDLTHAREEGVEYVTLSPMFATSSKPGYGPTIGLEKLSMLAALEKVPPLYALGGIRPGHARACLEAGAHGVAVMGAVMAASNPRRTTSDLLAELEG
ncbi:MAG: thiamine phosphate synthase [Chloroflexota bacterium]